MVVQQAMMATDTPHSRAGSLPQGMWRIQNPFKNDLHLY